MKYIIHIILTIIIVPALLGQNLGEYNYPYSTNYFQSDIEYQDHSKLVSELESILSIRNYPELSLQFLYQKESLGALHVTFQVLYKQAVIEQAQVKIHFDKKNHNCIHIQCNLPSIEEWNNLHPVISYIDNNMVWLVNEKQLLPAKKLYVEDFKTDSYIEKFILNSEDYYQNDLKSHFDTTAYAKVFLPDPLSSANQIYGGNYQDGLTKDTSALLIQDLNNSGGSTITANSTNYSYDGINFNVSTESYVNTYTAPIIHQYFTSIFISGQGSLLGYNTDITDNLSSVVTQIIIEDYNYPELAAEQVWVAMPADYSSAEFKLENDYFVISEFSVPFTNPTVSITDSFDHNRSELAFEDVNAFYHLNNFKSHWENLGFTGLASEAIIVDAHGNNGQDNSFFASSTPPRLVFGQGGVDDAEDADVIIHEYGHAISNFASPGSNTGNERRALDEGFGDYLASSYSRQYSATSTFNVFSWDGHNEFWNGRISNSNKTRADLDLNQNIYYNAEIWSSTLMDLHTLIGGDNCDKLAIEVMFYNTPTTTFTEAALHLFTADSTIFNGAFKCDIFQVLEARSFVVGTCNDFQTGIKDYASNNTVRIMNTSGFSSGEQNLLISIQDDEFDKGNLLVFNMSGAIVYESLIRQSETELTLDQLPPGIYFLDLQTNIGSYRFKVMKNK